MKILRVGDLVKIIGKDTKLENDSNLQVGPLTCRKEDATQAPPITNSVLDILNANDIFSIGQLDDLTGDSVLNTSSGLFIVIRQANTSILQVGDVLDVRIRTDATGEVVNTKATIQRIRYASSDTGFTDLGTDVISELELDRGIMANSMGNGDNRTFEVDDIIFIQKLGSRVNKLLNIVRISRVTNNTSFTLNDASISVEDDFQLHIIGRTQYVEGRCSNFYDMINVYSFALRPEDHQPSGTCNFSRIDNAKLEFGQNPTVTSGMLNIYAVNYNVLRIMSGMGGLAYSN